MTGKQELQNLLLSDCYEELAACKKALEREDLYPEERKSYEIREGQLLTRIDIINGILPGSESADNAVGGSQSSENAENGSRYSDNADNGSWYKDMDFLCEQLQRECVMLENVDFFFSDDPRKKIYKIGFCKGVLIDPYVISTCDLEEGLSMVTPQEIFEAKVFRGRSLKEQWDRVVITEMNDVGVKYLKRSWFE